MSPDQEVLNANQEAIAVAINSIAFANALAIVAISGILDAKGVIRKEQFGAMMGKLAGLATGPEGAAGAQMLRRVQEIIAEQTEPQAPRGKPFVVHEGGKQT